MSVSEDTKRWLAKADNDRVTAEDMTRHRGAALGDVICFHCQQAAEKYLKAVLIEEKVDFPKTHDLVELIDLAEPAAPDLGSLRGCARMLMPYAVEVRYAQDLPDAEAIEAALAAMAEVRAACLRALRIVETQDRQSV